MTTLGRMRTSYTIKAVSERKIGDVIPVVAARARMQLRVYRSGGRLQVLPAGDLDAAKDRGRAIYLDEPDVYRVDLLDPMKEAEIWSTDKDWPAR